MGNADGPDPQVEIFGSVAVRARPSFAERIPQRLPLGLSSPRRRRSKQTLLVVSWASITRLGVE